MIGINKIMIQGTCVSESIIIQTSFQKISITNAKYDNLSIYLF